MALLIEILSPVKSVSALLNYLSETVNLEFVGSLHRGIKSRH